MAGSEGGYDTEEEFERELAALGPSLSSDESESELTQDGAALDSDVESAHGEGKESSSGLQGPPEAVLPSFLALRMRLAQQDERLSTFKESLCHLGVENRDVGGLPAGGASASPPGSSGEPSGRQPVQPSAPSTEQEPPIVPASHRSHNSAGPGHGPGAKGLAGLEGDGDDRFAVWREFEAKERERLKLRETAQTKASAEAAQELRRLEAESAQKLEDLRLTTERRIAMFEAEAARELQRIDAEMDAAKRSIAFAQQEARESAVRLLAAERLKMDKSKRLEEARAKAARALEDQREKYARKHIAAFRIWRVWRRYASSDARRRRTRCITQAQAAIRGRLGRKAAVATRMAQAALKSMADARAQGDYTALEEAAAEARRLGLDRDAAQELSAFAEAARAAGNALIRASQVGDAERFAAALASASAFSSLDKVIREAESTFKRRQDGALQRLSNGAAGRETLVLLRQFAAAARKLGTSEDALQSALQAAAERDIQAIDALQAAIVAPRFDAADARRRLETVEVLGLAYAASSARQQLGLRQAAAVEALREAASTGGVHAYAEASAEAKSFGLVDAVETAERSMAKRKVALKDRLSVAAMSGSAREFQAAEEEAQQLNIDEAFILRQVATFRNRSEKALQEANDAASTSSISSFCALAARAQSLGLHDHIGKACAVMGRRQSSVLRALLDALRSVPLLQDPSQSLNDDEWMAVVNCETLGSVPNVLLSSSWDDFCSRIGGELEHPLAGALRSCRQLGLVAWTTTAWVALRTCAAATYSRSAGPSACIRVERDYWGASWSDIMWDFSRESALLADPISVLSLKLLREGRAVDVQPGLMWPQIHWPSNGADRPPECLSNGLSLVGVGPEHTEMPKDRVDNTSGSQMNGRDGAMAKPATHDMLLLSAPGVAIHQLTSVDLSLEGITSLGRLPQWCPQLQQLNASFNSLADVGDLIGCINLQHLDIRQNEITSLGPLSTLTSLKSLMADSNRIEQLAGLDACTALEDVSLAGNRISQFPAALIGALGRLQRISFRDNRLPAVSLEASAATSLQYLDVSNNVISALTGLQACPHLRVLRANANSLRLLPDIRCNSLLEELHLDENKLEILPPMPCLPRLRVVSLQDNMIRCISPMTSLRGLCNLNLSFNRLEDRMAVVGALAGASRLSCLQLSDNPVSGDPFFAAALLERLPQLQEFNLDRIMPDDACRRSSVSFASGPAAMLFFRGRLTRNTPLFPSRRTRSILPEREVHAMGAMRLRSLAEIAMGRPAVSGARNCMSAPLQWDKHPPGDGICVSLTPEDAGDGHVSATHDVLATSDSYAKRLKAHRSAAAAVMQAAWRRVLARRVRERLRLELQDARLNESARTVQRLWRGYVCRTSDDLQRLKAERQQRIEEERKTERAKLAGRMRALERARHAAAVKLQAAARGRAVRRRLADARLAARYNDLNDSIDFDEEVDLGFIQPPNGMEFNEDDGTAITLDVLEDWAPFGASSGASNRVPANPPTQLSPNPIGRNGLQADRSTDKFREALDRRRLSSSGSAGGPLIPTSSMAAAQQRVALAVKVDSYDPQQEGRSTAAWVESHAAGAAGSEALSPSAPSAAGASSVMSYGSSMKDEERRRKLRAKMDKVAGEWGFQNSTTAEAFYKAQQKRLRAKKKKETAKKFSNPQARLNKLKSQLEGRPQLHPSQVQRREPAHGPILHPGQSVLEGPPSQGSARPRPPLRPSSARGGHQNDAEPDGPHGAAPYPPMIARRALSEGRIGSKETNEENVETELPPILSRQYGELIPGSSSSDSMSTIEFRSGVPNQKLVRRALATGLRFPSNASQGYGGKQIADGSRLVSQQPQPFGAWAEPDNALPVAINGHSMHSHSTAPDRVHVGATASKPRIHAGAAHVTTQMQVLPSGRR